MATTVASPGMLTPDAHAAVLADQIQRQNSIYEMIGTNADAQAAAIEKAGYVSSSGVTAAAIETQQLAKLKAEQEIGNIRKATNWDTLAIEIGQDLGMLASKQRQQTVKLEQDKQVSLFDDPISAIINAFTIPWDEQALSATEERANVLKARMDAVNSHIQTSAKTAMETQQTITTAVIADTSARLAQIAAAQAAGARIEAGKTNAAAVQAAMISSAAQSQVYMQKVKLENDEETRKLQREAASRATQLFNRQMQEYKDKEQSRRIELGLINLALSSEGAPAIDEMGFERLKFGKGSAVQALREKGFLLSINEKVTDGDTVPERLAYRDLIGITPTSKVQADLIKMQREAFVEAGEKTVNRNPQQIAQNATLFFNERLKIYHNSINPQDQSNPYIAPAYGTLNTTPAVGQNPLWKKYILPTITNENARLPVDATRIFDAATKAIEAGDADINSAAAFVTGVFNKSVELNNVTHRLYKLTGSDQISYNTKVDVGTLGMNRLRVNTVDITDVKNKLAVIVSKAAFNKSLVDSPELMYGVR